MRLVGYLRVSTDAQVERGLGLEVQEAAIRSWADARGHVLVALTRDEGISGSNGLESRLGLDDAAVVLRRGTEPHLLPLKGTRADFRGVEAGVLGGRAEALRAPLRTSGCCLGRRESGPVSYISEQ
jgi:hypothetical protein